MRLSLVALIVLGPTAACRRKRPPAAPAGMEQPLQAAPSAPAPMEEEPAAPSPATAEAPAALRNTPPGAEEIRTVLEPALPAVGRCLTALGPHPDGGSFQLRFGVTPDGKVASGELGGAPGASDCLREALTSLEFSPWRGEPTIVQVTLDSEGQPR